MSKNKKQNFFKRSKVRYYRKITMWFIFAVVLLYGINFWTSHSYFKIKEVDVVGNRFIESQEIKNVFNDNISGKYLFLISKGNYFFIPKNKIIKELELKNSVDIVSIEKNDFNSVTIEINEYNPVASYCLAESQDGCYFVNGQGVFFVKAPDFYADSVLELEGDALEFSSENILGNSYTEQPIFEKLLKKVSLLKQEEIEIFKISTEDFETFTLHSVRGPVLLVEDTDISKEIISNLKAALAQESIHDIQFNNIDYIDLRFEDKVFYKLK